MRFVGLALQDAVPGAKTIWLYREQLVRAGAFDRLFVRFDAVPREAGYLAMGGQIVEATVVEARRPRLNKGEKDTLRGGGIPAEWSPARRTQIDTEGRWTIKRGRKREAPGGGSAPPTPGSCMDGPGMQRLFSRSGSGDRLRSCVRPVCAAGGRRP